MDGGASFCNSELVQVGVVWVEQVVAGFDTWLQHGRWSAEKDADLEFCSFAVGCDGQFVHPSLGGEQQHVGLVGGDRGRVGGGRVDQLCCVAILVGALHQDGQLLGVLALLDSYLGVEGLCHRRGDKGGTVEKLSWQGGVCAHAASLHTDHKAQFCALLRDKEQQIVPGCQLDIEQIGQRLFVDHALVVAQDGQLKVVWRAGPCRDNRVGRVVGNGQHISGFFACRQVSVHKFTQQNGGRACLGMHGPPPQQTCTQQPDPPCNPPCSTGL